ncbi:hypothetical protein M422DRAFT_22684 [Sphaerobolus stellatus SS14]|nr:hypothetical protein M422DRAFT_22684 [Sphaerobolus stellatus SS14]
MAETTTCNCLPDDIEVIGEPPSGSNDAQTIIPPSINGLKPYIVIEFCNRCRWLHRATWMLTELMLTFPNPTLKSISLIPLESPETAGRFRVWLTLDEDLILVWDRKTEGGFPELKILKQRIRDRIDPQRNLGHSDTTSKETT